jgi:acetyl esterase/lipase
VTALPAHLDPEMLPVLGTLPVLDLTDIATARAERAALAARLRAGAPPDPTVARGDHLVPGEPPVRVRRYRPAAADRGAPLPCLLWLHGGGHVIGEVEQDDPLMERLVRRLGIAAVSVDWRRAPEHPYPAEMDDAYAALRWVYTEAERLGVDPDRIAVGGASSGGGTAAGLCLLARDRGGPPIAFQLLVYPMLDDRTDGATQPWLSGPRSGEVGGLWHPAKNRLAWAAYLGGADPVPPYAAPARATDLSGLPPAFVATGDLDLFAAEDISYAARLVAAGVPTELHVYPGGVHGFDVFVPEGRLAGRLARDRDDSLAFALLRRNAEAQRLQRKPGQL